jgi:hypothetical protein
MPHFLDLSNTQVACTIRELLNFIDNGALSAVMDRPSERQLFSRSFACRCGSSDEYKSSRFESQTVLSRTEPQA